MNELFPAPEGPTTASIGCTLKRLAKASASRSRPKKFFASFAVKEVRPRYGAFSSAEAVTPSPLKRSSRSPNHSHTDSSWRSNPSGEEMSFAPRRLFASSRKSSSGAPGVGAIA